MNLGIKKSEEHEKNEESSSIKRFFINENLTNPNKKILETFFYSVAVNYSHYALNSKNIGYWINPLFHKNDAYLAPLVINPMRKEGNFDINEEAKFAVYRLLHNLLVRKSSLAKGEPVYLTDRQYVEKIRFVYNEKKVKQRPITGSEGEISGKPGYVIFIRDLQTVFYPEFLEEAIATNEVEFYKTELYNYLIQKIKKVSKTYQLYKDGYKFKGEQGLEENLAFLKQIKKDNTHIAFKIEQCFNFLANNAALENENEELQRDKKNPEPRKENKWMDGSGRYEFTLDELLDWMVTRKGSSELIKHIPPSIFDIEIILSDSKETANLSDLSSGELQLIHAVQSVLYHINNLESAHNNTDGRTTYKAINIIYDEIELYFHPEYQQQFIKRFLEGIDMLDLGQLAEDKGIKYINMIFSTHSPFILSDIPVTNILQLKNGKPKPESKQTFGANIHKLLANEFFLENDFMGTFAKQKIKETISFLEYHLINNEIRDVQNRILEYEGDSKKRKILVEEEAQLRENQNRLDEKIKNWNEEHHEQLIKLIGEPILQSKLHEMYDQAFISDPRKEAMAKIKRMAEKEGLDVSFNDPNEDD